MVINPTLTARQVQDSVGGEAANVDVSTIRRSLRRSGLVAYRPVPSPNLTAPRMRRRLQWAREHINWTAAQWKRIVFSDETTIEIGTVRPLFVRRERGERIRPQHTVQRRSFVTKVMFWGCITVDGPGPLVPLEGTITAARYLEVLQSNVLPLFAQQISVYTHFQQDNAPSHKARAVLDFFERNNIALLSWPPYTPDANCIENVWDMLKRKVQQRSHNTREQVIAAAQDVWRTDLQLHNMIEEVINSMPRRVAALQAARGGHTGY